MTERLLAAGHEEFKAKYPPIGLQAIEDLRTV